jgi:hypothetical protein
MSKLFVILLASLCAANGSALDPPSRKLTADEAHALVLASLLLIRLFQHATICSVGGCRARHFQRIWASFSVDSRPKRPASSIWQRVAGRRVSRARAVDTGARTS